MRRENDKLSLPPPLKSKRFFFGNCTLLCLFIAFLGANFSCIGETEKDEDRLSVLRIGILPDETKEQLLKRYTPLFKYLSKETDIPYELVIPKTYDELVKLFGEKKIDLAYFGGVTFVRAHTLYGAVPLVMRDVDIKFTSYFFSKGGLPARELSEFKNKKLCLGSKYSTSGYLMPRYFLKKQNIVPESFFSKVHFSGSHDQTVYMVRDGKMDLGAANSRIVDKMFSDGRLRPGDVRIIWETPPYPDYVWTARSELDKSVRAKIRDAFLGLTPADKLHTEILKGVDAAYFLPASTKDFSELEGIIEKLKLVKAEK